MRLFLSPVCPHRVEWLVGVWEDLASMRHSTAIVQHSNQAHATLTDITTSHRIAPHCTRTLPQQRGSVSNSTTRPAEGPDSTSTQH